MKIINKYIAGVLLLILAGSPVCSQEQSVNYIKTDKTLALKINEDYYDSLRVSNNQQALFKEIMTIKTVGDSTIGNLFDGFVDSRGEISDGCAVVLVRYGRSKVNPANTNFAKLNPITITREKGKYGSYILNKKHILLIFLDSSRLAESFRINNKTSYFSNSLNGIIKIVEDTYLGHGINKNVTQEVIDTIRFVELDPKKIVPPSDISFAVPVKDKSDKTGDFKITDNTPYDTAKLTIHERNYFSFSVGLNGSFLNKQNFKITGDTVTVTLDSAQKKQLSNSITLSIEFYPFGRDIDRFLPLWKDFKNIKQHLGISAGISLSKDPLQSYYLGLAICLTKEFNVVAGVNFANTTKSDQYQITNITSVGDLEKYALGRSYKSSFYIGISLSPAQAIKNLGL